MAQSKPTKFLVDTHTLWWLLQSSPRLSPAAGSIIREARGGNGTIVVPAIVIAELYHLSVKERQPISPAELMADLASEDWIELTDLGRAQLEYLDRLPEITEMHDKLIAAESIILGAPLLTRDGLLLESPNVETIW